MSTVEIKQYQEKREEISSTAKIEEKHSVQTFKNVTKPTDNFEHHHQPQQEIKPDTRLKSLLRTVVIGLIISLSALIFGYGLKEITSVPIAKIQHQYSITMSSFAAQSILIGLMPLGAIVGAFVTKFLIKRHRRLTGIYIFTLVNVGAIVLVNITTFATLIAGRLIEGICVGYYTTIAPIYLKQIAPKQLRKILGLFFSLGRIVGILIVIILELIFEAYPFSIDFRVILSMTAVFSILQAILIFFFGSDTPAQWIEKGNEQEAIKIIEQFYKEPYVKQVFQEYKKEYQMQMNKGKETLSENLNAQKKTKASALKKESKKRLQFLSEQTEKQLHAAQSEPNPANFTKLPKKNQEGMENNKPRQATFEDKKDSAYYLVIHLSVIRHWTGGNAITIQGGLFIKTFDQGLGQYTSIIINSVQLIFVIIGLVYVQKIVGKRPLFLFSITLMSLLNLALVVSIIHSQVLASILIMCLFMAVYGGSFISPSWSYPSEVIPTSQALLPNVAHWLALATSTLIPPLVTGGMPNNNPYPVFVFFGVYGLLSLIHVFRRLKQSDGKSYDQIINSFQ